ncbi:hypothetical protein ACIBG0_36125 [Nocardia sp. NPDC050630]|uniref:hypothetical protein n=1 Tax=Nocardia sp. NPDC050630 TaxID=3364321 RepID=UPI0037AF2C7F
MKRLASVRSLDSILLAVVVLIAYRSYGPHLECPNRVLYKCVGVPDACTLPTAEQPIRVAEFDRFFAESVSRRPDRTRLDLLVAVDAEPAGGDLAVRETGCCSFSPSPSTPPMRGQ